MREKKIEINEIDKLVARRLRHKRRELGISLSQLGNHINVTVQQIQKYESGINRISSGKLYYIAKYLDVPVSYFFEDDWQFLMANAA